MADMENSLKTAATESPCIGICSTVYGDNICRGCKRNFKEVIEWNRYADEQKQLVNTRLLQQIEKVVTTFIVVDNAQILKAQFDRITLRPALYESPYYWAYELLRLRARQITTLRDYGLQTKPAYQALSANQLFTQIDDALYKLANKM